MCWFTGLADVGKTHRMHHFIYHCSPCFSDRSACLHISMLHTWVTMHHITFATWRNHKWAIIADTEVRRSKKWKFNDVYALSVKSHNVRCKTTATSDESCCTVHHTHHWKCTICYASASHYQLITISYSVATHREVFILHNLLRWYTTWTDAASACYDCSSPIAMIQLQSRTHVYCVSVLVYCPFTCLVHRNTSWPLNVHHIIMPIVGIAFIHRHKYNL
jgi:hypothetical protein